MVDFSGGQILFFPFLKDNLTKSQWFCFKEILNTLCFSSIDNRSRKLLKAIIAIVNKEVDQGGFTTSRPATDDNFFIYKEVFFQNLFFILITYICTKLASLMVSKENSDEFYSRFYSQLEKSQSWPGTYMFKFIVKTENPQVDNLKALFNAKEKKVSLVASSKKKFQSLTITLEMNSPDEVITIYKKAAELKDVIKL